MTTSQLLGWAADEIVTLRRRNEIMEAQLQIVDTFGAALLGRRDVSMSMRQDFLPELKKRVEELAGEVKAPKAPMTFGPSPF